MLRLFALLSLFFLNLYSCHGGYSSCIAKIKDSNTLRDNSLYIPVKNHKLLVYSKREPKEKILKYDPFLSLYLIEDKNRFAYPFDINMRLQLGTALVDNKIAKEGKILSNQVGLNHFAHYSEKQLQPALITSSCCSLEGIVTQRGVIQKEYIKRFLQKNTKVIYGDIGVRLKSIKGSVYVTARDPFLENNSFKKGDIIVSFDKKKVDNAASLMQTILFLKIGTLHDVVVKRSGKKIILKVKSVKRYGGGFLSDTFLEQKGIYFDTSLHIVKLSKKFRAYGMQLGDQLLQVNGTTVKNQDELLRYIEDFKDYSTLLFERSKFQFFVNIK